MKPTINNQGTIFQNLEFLKESVCVLSCSVLSNPLQPHGLKPARLLHGIFHARILEWVVISASKDPGINLHLLHWQADSLPGKPY